MKTYFFVYRNDFAYLVSDKYFKVPCLFTGMTLRTWSVTSTLKYRVCYRNDFAYLVSDK